MPVSLELGGKSPHIVFADADLDAAVAAVAGGIFEGSGQSCVAGSRLFVQRGVHAKRGGRAHRRGARAARGSARRARRADGPARVVRAPRPRRAGMVDAARAEGADILCGGTPPATTALAQRRVLPAHGDRRRRPSRRHRAAGDLRSGAVRAALRRRRRPDRAGQRHRLRAGRGRVDGDVRRAWRVARRLEAGTVWINTYKQLSIATPFGGFKDSGIGREKGIGGLRAVPAEPRASISGSS